jgi:exosortase
MAWVMLGMALLLTLDQWHYWATQEDFSFGFLVPLFVAYVVLERWAEWKKLLLGAPAVPGAMPVAAGDGLSRALEIFAMVVVLGSLLIFSFGGFLRAVTGPDSDAALYLAAGFAGFVLAMAFLAARVDAAGRALPLRARGRVVALLVFPALVWLISAPMLLVFGGSIEVVLLKYIVGSVTWIFDFLGYSIFREGNVLVLPSGRVGVEEACSGIRSLTACLFAGSFLAAVFLDRFWKKALLLGMSAVLALATNLVRSLFLTSWAYVHGADALGADFWGHPEKLGDAAHGWTDNPAFRFISVHDFAGYAVLILTLIGLLLLLPLLNFQFRWPDDDAPAPNPPG